MPTTMMYRDVSIEMTRKAVKYCGYGSAPTGTVYLSVPWHCPQAQVNAFVVQHWSWVEAQRAKCHASESQSVVSADAVVVFGVRYPLDVVVQPHAASADAIRSDYASPYHP
jgi:predicted metal-dependent hydrolase